MSTTVQPRAIPHNKRKPIDWDKVWAWILFILWTVAAKGIVFILCEELMSDGAMNIAAILGKKLWKVPGFWWLDYYEATHRLTLANLFVLLPVTATFMLYSRLFLYYLARDRFDEKYQRWNPERYSKLIIILAAIIVPADAGIFFASFGSGSWGGNKFGPTTFLATALYSASIAFVSLISVFLGDGISVQKEKEKVSE